MLLIMSETYNVIITPEAQADIRGIVLYVARELAVPQAAKSLEQAFRSQINSLSTMPKRFKTVDEQPWKDQGIRRTLVKKYYIYYVVDEEVCAVKIIAAIFAGRDQEQQLSDRNESY